LRAINGKKAGKKSVVAKTITKKAAGKRPTTGSDRVSHPRASPDYKSKSRVIWQIQTLTYIDDDSILVPTTTVPTTELTHSRSESPLFEPSIDSEELNEALAEEYGLDPTSEDLLQDYNMDGFKRARAIKTEIQNNISVLLPQDKKASTRRNVEEDPENITIKTLRTEQKMSWKDIADFLNKERCNKGEAATFTESAVYGRFVQVAYPIATSVGEIGFHPKDYMHLRNPNQYINGNGTGTISKAGKKRVKNYDNALELKANVRQRASPEEHEELKTTEKTEQLMQAVAVIERNFWSLVADEMERATTKLYEPDELASRYHSI
jgi:hypothetical protein